MLFFLACAPSSTALVPTDGFHAWSDPDLAGCTVTWSSSWDGDDDPDSWSDTFDADGKRVSSLEDVNTDGVDDATWTHTWSGETVDTVGSSLVETSTYTDVEHREFDGPRLLRWEVNSFWQEDDMAATTTGAVITTWDGDLPVQDEMYEEPEAVTLAHTTTWEWADDLGSAVVTDEEGHSLTRTYDADMRLVEQVVHAYEGGPTYDQVTSWTYGELGPERRTFDNDEDGDDEAELTWVYDCP